MPKQLNFGIIGAGRIGRVHAESLAFRNPAANLLAVSDIFLDSAKSCAADFNIPTATESHYDILNNPEIDAVVICSSTDTHTQFITEAAEAGKHIFCEKPIALELDKIDLALAAVDKAGVKLQIGFNRRFDSNFRHMRETVQSGGIGAPHILRIMSRDPAPPPVEYIKVSGGIFLDMMIHDFDIARFLLDDEVEEVYTAAGVMIDPAIGEAGDVDTAVVTLKFSTGAIGVIDNSRQAVYGYDQRAEVFGSKGSVEAVNKSPYDTVHRTAAGVQHAKPHYFFLERYMDAYVDEMQAFVRAIKDDLPVPVGGKDGRAPVVIGQAAWLSYRENRPVKLSEISS